MEQNAGAQPATGEVRSPPEGGTGGGIELPRRLRKPRLRRAEAVEYLLLVHGLPIAVTTLAKLACLGGGPPFYRNNRTPLYACSDLDTWALTRLGPPVHSTSETRP